MKTFESWLNKKGYEFMKEDIFDGAKVEFKMNGYTIQMYRHRRGGYLLDHSTGSTTEFYTVKEIKELMEFLIEGIC